MSAGGGGSLAGAHGRAPGLPRGRSRLDAGTVRAAQRERLLRAMVAAAAETGYAAVTVADVVRRARVSRNAFYESFADKEDCFIAASDGGCEVMLDRIAAAGREVPPDADPVLRLRAALRAYLAFLAGEPEFTRIFHVEILAAGPRALDHVATAHGRFAALHRAWHRRARRVRPDWPPAPREAYPAMVGAVHELVLMHVRAGRTAELPRLEDVALQLLLGMVRAPAEAPRRVTPR